MIRILDSFIADKIAAGEVIERPVSAVKELIENSIDAGSKSVIVEIRGGGNTYIRITDDGCGISFSEIETAFLRHATSKISAATDLDNIQSLGFRGEALASISAVSRLTIVSRTSDEQVGTKLILHAGKVISKEKVGANKGTTIIVEDLFYNTPARRKFMKSDAREASAVIELIQQYAICYSNIRFMMINNGQTLFSTDGIGNCETAIKSLYPDKAHSSLIPVNGEKVRGYISAPGTTISSRKGQMFFVNGRLVSSKTIEKALTEGYGGRIFSGFPIAFLFIEEEPREIDVNIHPGKREILFLHADKLIERISRAVSDAVDSEASIPMPELRVSAPIKEDGNRDYIAAEKSDIYKESDILETTSFSAVSEQSTIKEYLGSLKRSESDDNISNDEAKEAEINILDSTDDESSFTDLKYANDTVNVLGDKKAVDRNKSIDFDSFVFKGYVFDTYIIMQAGESLFVFDQHAAHERIFYEKLLAAYNASEKLSQPILSPIMINVSSDVYQMKDDMLSIIGALGYDISDFGSGTFMIREIPSFMTASEAEKFVYTFCDSSEIGSIINDSVIEKLIMKSCKSAVKGGDRLSDIEIKELIKTLSECSNPYACPHGRPTFVKITRYDIERAFKRI